MTAIRHAALTLLLAGAGLASPRASAAQDSTSRSPARVAFTHALPTLDGKRLEATVVEVTYGPGQSSPPHRHPCPVVGYVIEGEYRSQSGAEPAVVYRAGRASTRLPMRYTGCPPTPAPPGRCASWPTFVCDRQGPLSVPAERP